MDYASVNRFLDLKGFHKKNTTTEAITQFKTEYINLEENRTIFIEWELGGYVKKISSGNTVLPSENFFETFS
jgi:hypothetical protein